MFILRYVYYSSKVCFSFKNYFMFIFCFYFVTTIIDYVIWVITLWKYFTQYYLFVYFWLKNFKNIKRAFNSRYNISIYIANQLMKFTILRKHILVNFSWFLLGYSTWSSPFFWFDIYFSSYMKTLPFKNILYFSTILLVCSSYWSILILKNFIFKQFFDLFKNYLIFAIYRSIKLH